MRGRLVGSVSDFDVEHMVLTLRLQERRGGWCRGIGCVGNFLVLLGISHWPSLLTCPCVIRGQDSRF
jgi:hypothetical protein